VLLRRSGSTAIKVGRTGMGGGFEEAPFRATSRQIHVLVEDRGSLVDALLASTPIVGDGPDADRPGTGL